MLRPKSFSITKCLGGISIMQRNCTTTASRIVYSKGLGLFGSLGHGSNLADCDSYKRVEALSDHDAVSINVGMGHSSVILSTGELLLFGRPYEIDNLLKINRFRVLSPALARFVNRTSSSSLFGDLLLTPTHLDCFKVPVKKLKSIGGLNIILTQSGEVFNLGAHRWGSTTLNYMSNSAEDSRKTPKHIYIPDIVTNIDIGLQHCIICTREGLAYTWGAGERGQLGNGKLVVHTTPTVVKIPKKIIDIGAGFQFSCALSEEGSLYVWGKFMSTKLAEASRTKDSVMFEDQLEPRELKLPNNLKIKEICSCAVTVALRAEDDTLWIMGIADHDHNVHNYPVQVMSYQPSSDKAHDDSRDMSAQPIQIPRDAKLKRGHTKISIIFPKSPSIDYETYGMPHTYSTEYVAASSIKDDQFVIESINKVFDIVLTDSKAFLSPVRDIFFEKDTFLDKAHDKSNGNYSIEDYSCGWQHSMLILKDDNI